MKASELRIGNIVLRNGILFEDKKKFSETTVDHNDVCACTISPSSFRPVPLTKEWFEKLGAIVDQDVDALLLFIPESNKDGVSDYLWFQWEDYDSEYYPEGVFLYANTGSQTYPIRKVDFVHQLQNLHFDLSDKELTISA